MPTLKHFLQRGAPFSYSVHKPVTTLGRALGNDVALKADEAVGNLGLVR